MSDTANIVGKVTTDTSQSVRSVEQLKRSVDTLGGGFAGFANKASSALGSVADGFAKFNLALGGIQKALNIAGDVFGMAKFSAEAQFAEKRVRELGSSAYELSSAVGGTVDDVTLLKFALKNLQGETALTKEQMLLVLKAADSLGDQGFGDTMKIAEDLAKALKGGPTKALREYGIQIDDLKDGLSSASVLMGKMKDIAAQTVANDDIERLERLEAAWKNLINTLKGGASYLVDAASWVSSQYTDDSWLVDQAGLKRGGGFAHFQMQRLNKLRAQAMQQYQTGQAATALYQSGAFDAASGYLSQWSGMDLSGIPGASWFSPAPQAAKKTGGGGQAAQRGGGLDFDKIAAGFKAAYDKEAAERQNQRGWSEIDAINRDLANTLAGASSGLDETAEAMAQIAESAEQLRQAALAEQMETLSQVMIVGTPAVVAFADALMTGGNAFTALAKGLQQGLRALAIDSAVKALYALGEGFLFSNPKAFAAAAKYTAAAAAAGVGSAAIGALVGSGGGGGSSASAGSSFSSGAGASITGGSGGGGPVVINVQGNLYGEPAAFGRAVADGLDAAQRSGRTRLRSNRYH